MLLSHAGLSIAVRMSHGLQAVILPDGSRSTMHQAVSPGEDRQVTVVTSANITRNGNAPAYNGVQDHHLSSHDACTRRRDTTLGACTHARTL